MSEKLKNYSIKSLTDNKMIYRASLQNEKLFSAHRSVDNLIRSNNAVLRSSISSLSSIALNRDLKVTDSMSVTGAKKYDSLQSLYSSLNNQNNFSDKYLSKLIKINKVIDSFEGISKTFSKSVNQIALNGISGSITSDYVNSIYKHIENINNSKTQDYLNIISRINLDKINELRCINDSIKNVSASRNLKPIETSISKYVGYAFRNDSQITIDEAYDKSKIKEIEVESDAIFSRIKIINGREPNFFSDKDSLCDLLYNMKTVCENERGFSDIINYFFKALYEGSGVAENRIFKLNSDEISEILLTIKHIRACYDHAGKDVKENVRKKKDDYIKNKIGIELGIYPRDWVKLQIYLYKDINRMLELIIQKI